jgi:2-succinyl-5-enolpyruvyl-6-hydroxy-3-cyclohexene-1-carboxylate synthase
VGEIAAIEEPFEGRVFAELAELLPEGATLFAGNSMPVRDLDSFFPSRAEAVRMLANRGTNGIDGVVSTALGVAAVSDGPLVLVIGDLSLYHDMNGLLAARLHRLDATIVLLNNDGGGIFSFLPQADHPEHFERLFGTPHGLDFRPAVEMYGGRFERVADWAAFREAVARALPAPGLKVVELPTERRRNVELHRRVWPAVSAAIERLGAVGALSSSGQPEGSSAVVLSAPLCRPEPEAKDLLARGDGEDPSLRSG